MALDNFIPTVWSARLLAALHKNLVYGQPDVINRDYEGDIAQAGDTVKIGGIGPVTVSSYTKNSNMSAAETLADSSTVLTIDQAKYFNFQVDDIDKAQTKPKVMDDAMGEAAYALRDNIDQSVAGLYTDASATNLIGTTASPKTDAATAGQPYVYLTQLRQKLDEANVPDDGTRFVIIPPWYETYLLQDSKFVANAASAPDSTIRNGQIRTVLGMNVLKSNNVPNTSNTKYRIVAGHRMAWSLAVQVNKIEAYRMELRFADAVKGLVLYGRKVTRASALAVLCINPT
ncbi:Major capsid protein Gp5 [uncultured Caudovirales phage]|uniref:Major capsid protein Gp5 n=1 Tax=uncultured Caudovirales phage TaxID=2100421 RepID=A0A6J5MRK0_9CAUD|nr:Major capsid protein Gp5 [uncultured Caudovirales phage]